MNKNFYIFIFLFSCSSPTEYNEEKNMDLGNSVDVMKQDIEINCVDNKYGSNNCDDLCSKIGEYSIGCVENRYACLEYVKFGGICDDIHLCDSGLFCRLFTAKQGLCLRKCCNKNCDLEKCPSGYFCDEYFCMPIGR